ncbi:MAG: hypothetical protein R3C61_05575 [Bacteroidia bacterium]
MKSQEEIENLIEHAWDLIQADNLEQAAEIGRELKAEGVESGYRIVAMTYAMEENYDEAIAEIEAGIKTLPDAWQLHLQLGNFLSDKGDFDAALRTFDQTSRMPGAERHWINMNKAVVYTRKMDFDQALTILQDIEHPEAVNQAIELQLRILDQLGRHDLILEMEEELEYLQTPEDEAEAEILSQICTYIARAYFVENQNEPARHYVRQAIEYDRCNEDAAAVLREITGRFSEKSQIFSLIVSGVINDPDSEDEIPFLTTYGVVATSESDALEMIREFEIDAVVKDSLLIEEADSTDNEDGDPCGIYLVGGMAFPEN